LIGIPIENVLFKFGESMSRTKPSDENKKIAKHAAAAFGGAPSVSEYLHDTEPLAIPILSCESSPCEGVTAYSTVGLSDFPMLDGGGADFPVRLEIAGACATQAAQFANVVSTAAFIIMRTRKPYHPGAVMRGVVQEYFPATTVPHLYFTTPFLWEDSPKTLDCGTKKASWLLVVPISDAEMRFLEKHGDNALEDLFEKEQIDVFDLDRSSVV
jgi:hypothetical protein